MSEHRPDRPTLLLVDDEPDILVALEDLFETRYRPIALTSAAEALERLRAEPDVAVIVSDQRMPGMTGDAFLAEARKISDANAILLTGYADLSAVTAALNEGGIIGYAPKPWEPDALKAMVATAAEQHRLRRALRQEQALLRGLMDHLPAEVAFKDEEGRFLKINARKAERLGIDPEAAAGRSEQDFGETPAEAEQQARAEGRPVQGITERASEQGPGWTETTAVPLGAGGARVSQYVVIERDVTAQKLAELQVRQTDKLRALGTLAGGVAHDFNNLLTAILGSLELASRRMGDEAALRRYLDNAVLAAQRGASLTQRLLGFSRQTDTRPRLVDLGAVLAETRELAARALGAGVTVDWRVAPDLWPTAIEPDQFELALLNLCVNARDASPVGGVVTVEAVNVSIGEDDRVQDLAPGDYAVVRVCDRGHGMTPEVLGRILEPFFTTKPVGKGTGLGLPMVYGFAQRSGGALDICSQPGEGTRVSLYLPRARGEAEAGSETAHGERAVEGPALTILVVDDEPAVRSVTATFLRDLGHRVVEAANGKLALKHLQSGDIDLAIVDFAMPGMNGVEFSFKARRRSPDLPIILLTGYFDVQAVPKDVSIMHKPFTNATLQNAIAQAVPTDALEKD